MFGIGRWNNYDELEESLTLAELMETYMGIREQEHRQTISFARVMGAEVGDDHEANFGKVVENAKKRREVEDIVTTPISDRSGSNFGVGAGLGYTEV